MARLIRTEKEVEGRFEEVWIVVEEDPLEQWPEGPLEVVGKPAPRRTVTSACAARRATRPTSSCRGCSTQRFCGRLTRMRGRGDRPRAGPGAAGRSRCARAGEAHGLEEEPGFSGAAVAAVAADTFAQARAAVEAIEVEWEELEVVLDPDKAVERELLTAEPRTYERGDVEKALAQADVVVEATYRTRTVLHNSLETHQALCEWQGHTLHIYISTQFIWGVRQAVADTLGLPEDKVRVVCEYMGGGFGSKTAPTSTRTSRRSSRSGPGRPVRCALTRRERHTSAGNATPRSSGSGRGPQRRDDRRVRRRVHELRRLVGLERVDRGADADALRLRERPHRHRTAHSSTRRPMKAFRRPASSRGRSARVPGRRARGEARRRPARVAAPQLRELERGHAVLVQEPRGAATAAPSRTGSGGTRAGARSDAYWKRGVGMASQIGTAAAALPPTRACGSASTAARP